MPSDPSGHNPQGVLVRSAPDFFDDNLCVGGTWFQFGVIPTRSFCSTSLYNNDTLGRVLKVYGVTALVDNGQAALLYPNSGAPLGALVGNCLPVRFDLGIPPGLIYSKLDSVPLSNSPNPNNPPTNAQLIGGSFGGGISYFSPFPIAIIPRGWSLVVVNMGADDTGGASFWYQVANE